MCFLGSEQYEGNDMFPLLLEEGGEKSWPNVPQELLNKNTCLGAAVQSFKQYMAVVGGGHVHLGGCQRE